MKGLKGDNMKVISNYNNEEGIEILMQIADDIQAIMTDKDVAEALDGGNFMKIGAAAYKNCRKNVENVFKALGEKPETAIAYTVGITHVILDIVGDPDCKDFFTFINAKTDSMQSASATENTEGEA